MHPRRAHGFACAISASAVARERSHEAVFLNRPCLQAMPPANESLPVKAVKAAESSQLLLQLASQMA